VEAGGPLRREPEPEQEPRQAVRRREFRWWVGWRPQVRRERAWQWRAVLPRQAVTPGPAPLAYPGSMPEGNGQATGRARSGLRGQ